MMILNGLLISMVWADHMQAVYHRNVWRPEFHSNRLNYCMDGDKVCGLPVAKLYCQNLGYEDADKAMIEYNVGFTRDMASSRTCQGLRCNGFKLIRCKGRISHSPPETYYYRYRRFSFPRMNHYRLDWCYENGTGCGQKAAHAFCRRLGYLRSDGYKKQANVHETKAVGNQRLCIGAECQAFSEITCFR